MEEIKEEKEIGEKQRREEGTKEGREEINKEGKEKKEEKEESEEGRGKEVEKEEGEKGGGKEVEKEEGEKGGGKEIEKEEGEEGGGKETEKEKEGEEEQANRKSKKRYVALFGDIVVLVVALAYTLLCAMVNTEHILPNTEVNGVQLGSMSAEEATKALEADRIARCGRAEFQVAFGEDIYKVPIGDALELDCEALAQDALKQGQGSFFARGGLWLSAFLGGTKKESLPKVTDLDALHKDIKDSGLLELDTTTQTSYKKKKNQLVFKMGKTGEVADEKKLIEQIITAAQIGDFETIIQCPTEAGKVEEVDLEKIYKEIHRKPANATLDPKKNYEIVEAVKGVSFNKKKAKKALEQAEEGSTVAIDLIYTKPEISTKALRKRLFQDQLATFTTKVTGSENRRANIRLAVEKCNGAILCKGDVFSFNDTVGEQTAETGFLPANAIQGTEVVQAYGGGICQVSTTMFEAALYAGLEIPERWCHVYISSYADPGMDAAVAWGALDLKIKNQNDYPVKLEVKEEGEDLTVTVWGTKLEERPIEVEVVEKGKEKSEDLEDSGDTLEVVTYRNIYNEDKTQVYREKIGESVYRDPSRKVD